MRGGGRTSEERGQIVEAHVVLKPGTAGDDACAKRLQEHVKATIAPYKYPRSVKFVDALPKTQTGKIHASSSGRSSPCSFSTRNTGGARKAFPMAS